MKKNEEIAAMQKKQKAVKKEIVEIKKKLPTYIIGFILFTILTLYFFEDKFHLSFGNSINFIIAGVIICGIICLFLIYRIYSLVDKKKLESKNIGTKLYNMMRLDQETNNE